MRPKGREVRKVVGRKRRVSAEVRKEVRSGARWEAFSMMPLIRGASCIRYEDD